MAAEADLDHLRTVGYVILQNCIESGLVRDARNSIEDKVKEHIGVSKTEHFVPLFQKFDDWPLACKRLSQEIMVCCNVDMETCELTEIRKRFRTLLSNVKIIKLI